MGRVGLQGLLSQDKATSQLFRNSLNGQRNSCNSPFLGCYRFARQRWPLLVTLISVTSGTAGLRLGVGLNLSGSAPRGVYLTVGGAPARGTLVVACLPAVVAAFGRARR